MSEYIRIGDSAIGGTRPGRSRCECQHDHGDRLDCPRMGSMHDGVFMCGPCWRGRKHRTATLEAFEGPQP